MCNKPITFFICSLSSGGAERQLLKLAEFLLSYKYNISIVTFSDVEDYYYVPKEIKRIRLGVRKNKILKYIIIFFYFLTLKTNCVISYGKRENFYSLIPLFFRKKIKVICSERSLTVKGGTIKEKFLLKFLYKRANYIVPNSFSQKKYIESVAPELSYKVNVITNFTDLNMYKYSYKSTEKKISIGIFSSFTPVKNCIRFAKAVYKLKFMYSDKFEVHWFGNRTDKLGNLSTEYVKLENLIVESNISDSMYLHDRVHDVEKKMRQFDAICLPSLYEGFSNTISEGICSGKPMLVSNVSDNGLMVKSYVNGLLFDPTNIDDMADKIHLFLHFPVEKIKEMGLNSRKIAEKLFNKDRFVNSYIELIEK